MSDLSKKYAHLARAATKVIDLDNEIIEALQNGDPGHLLQAMFISRVIPLQTVRRLAAWVPPTESV